MCASEEVRISSKNFFVYEGKVHKKCAKSANHLSSAKIGWVLVKMGRRVSSCILFRCQVCFGLCVFFL